MAFNKQNFARISTAYNTGRQTVDGVVVNGPAVFTYQSATDTLATIVAANYFAEMVYSLAVNDRIDITGSDASGWYLVATVDREAGTITLVSYSASAPVGTANIQDGAVTTAKIADGDVTTAKLDDEAVTSAKIDPAVLQYVAVPLTAANIIAMNAAPVEVLAAAGANTAHIVEHAALMMTYGTTQFTGGGAIGLQYGDTAALAGEAASSTIAAANIQGAASTMDMVEGAISGAAFADVANEGLYISNDTAAFAGGDSDFVLHLWYRTVPTV